MGPYVGAHSISKWRGGEESEGRDYNTPTLKEYREGSGEGVIWSYKLLEIIFIKIVF